MAIQLNDNLLINAGKPVDSKYLASTNQPYASVGAANTAIPESYRYIGLKVNVANVEYWYYTGVTDSDLVALETPASTSGVTKATNGITLLGDDTTVVLGGALTGATTLNINGQSLAFSTNPVEYAGDYNAQLTARKIPDAGYVTGLTSGLQGQITSNDNDILYLSGETSGNTVDISTNAGLISDNAADIVYVSGVTDQNLIDINADLAYISGSTDADFAFVSGQTDLNTADIAFLGTVSGVTEVANGLEIGTGGEVVLGGTLTGDTAILLDGNSIKFGDLSIANNTSFAFGEYACATGFLSVAMGSGARASGNTAASFNNSTAGGGFAFSAVKGCAMGDNSVAIGFNAKACSDYSAALGGYINTIQVGSNNSSIIGGCSNIIQSGNTHAAIIGGASITLTPDAYINTVAVNNLAIFTTPATGVDTDGVLIWDSTTKKVKQIAASVIGGVTGADNGLTVDSNKTVVLGGTLTGDTQVTLDTHGLILGSGGTTTGDNSLVFIYGDAIGESSIGAIGGTACGIQSWAVGNDAIASGACSVAFGGGCAIGAGSLALGGNSSAGAANSVVIGGNSQADGFGSFAFGSFVCSDGTGSIGFGVNAHAHGDYSFAFGKGISTKEVTASGLSSINFSTNTSAQIVGHGASANYSSIWGGINHDIEVGNVGAAIVGRYGTTGIQLTGTDYIDHTVVPSLALWATPATDDDGDVLVWDSTSKKVGISSVAALGALSGATNGLQVIDQEAALGGTLTEATTSILGATNNLSIGTTGSRVGILTNAATNMVVDAATCLHLKSTTDAAEIIIDGQNQGQVLIKSQTGTAGADSFTTAVGFNLDFANDLFKVVDNRAGANCKGIEYQSDYSTNYTDRSLVDKAYVDSVAAGLDAKDAVIVSTTAAGGNIDLTGGTFVSGTTLDGIIVDDGWRVLVKDQTDAVENGIWVYSASTSGFTRADDFDGAPSGEVSNGAFTTVITGDTLINTQWIVTTPDPITVDVTEINWSLLSQQLGIQAGTGITVTTVNSLNTISTKLAGTSSLSYDGGLGLRVDSSIAGSGLTYNAGIVGINANTGGVTTEIDVYFGASNNLVVREEDFSYTTASNGLTKIGTNVTLGGTLTGDTNIDGSASCHDFTLTRIGTFDVTFDNVSTITDNGSNGGLRYATNYEGNFVCHSLVDYNFVTGCTSNLQGQITTNAGNISDNAADIVYLSGETGQNTIDISDNTADIAFLGVFSGDTVADLAFISGQTDTNTGNISTNATNINTNANDISFLGGISGLTVSALQTANNGLTVDGTNVRLGGTLTGDTQIDTAGFGVQIGTGTFCALGADSVTFGQLTRAEGAHSFAGGYQSLVCSTGVNSIAFGNNIKVEGANSAAFGQSTQANGTSSFGFGLASIAICNYTIAMGAGARTASDYTTAIGGCNPIICTGSQFSAVLGGNSNTIESGNTCSAIIAGNAITLTADNYSNYVAVPNLAIFSTPATGASDDLLVWDSADKKVKKVAQGSVGITTANNGLSVCGTNFVLGGTLTGDTSIDLDSNVLEFATNAVCYAAGVGDSFVNTELPNVNYVTGLTDGLQTQITQNASDIQLVSGVTTTNAGNIAANTADIVNLGSISGLTESALQTANNGLTVIGTNAILGGSLTGDTTINLNSNALKFEINPIEYTGDYSAQFTARKIPDAGFVTGLTSGLQSQITTNAGNISDNAADIQLVSGVTTTNAGNISTNAGNISDNAADIQLVSGVTTTNASNISTNAGNISDNAADISALGAISGLTESALQTANNGLTVSGTNVRLGGTLTGDTAISLGGNGLVIGTGSQTANYVTLNNLALDGTPDAGSATGDAILVWNSTDKKVKQVDASSLGEDNNVYAITGISTNTTVTPNEYVVVVDTSGGAVTVTLPAAPVTGQAYKIKDSGNALTNQVTIGGNAKNIDGAGTASINTDYGALEVVYDGTEWWTLAFIN